MPEVADTNLGNAFTLEEMAAEAGAPASPPAPSEIKLEGEKVPEAYRGKSVDELIERQNRLEESLRLSESARLSLQQSAERPAPVYQQPVEQEIKQLTREELQTMYEENPIQAIEAMQNQAIQLADRHFSARFSQLESSSASTNENWARQEFGDEFKVLGPEIQQLYAQIPDKRVFSDKQSWKDLISYVRGQDGNFEKLMEFKQNGKAPKTAESARAEQSADAGYSSRSRQLPSAPSRGTTTLDPVTRRIAENLGFESDAEYIKWANIGQQG